MAERAAFIAGGVDELKERLSALADGREGAPGILRGRVKASRGFPSDLDSEAESQEAIDEWIERREYGKLLELWVKGFPVDFEHLHDGSKHTRLRLPAYPFAPQRYWLPGPAGPAGAAVLAAARTLHPLLQVNTSDLSSQRFSSTFTGGEPFFADHVVAGRRTLPAAAFLEMAAAAIRESLRHAEGVPLTISDLVSATSGRGRQLVRRSHRLGGRRWRRCYFEVYTDGEPGEAEVVVHSRGVASLAHRVPARAGPRGDPRTVHARALECPECLRDLRGTWPDLRPVAPSDRRGPCRHGRGISATASAREGGRSRLRAAPGPARRRAAGMRRRDVQRKQSWPPTPYVPFTLDSLEVRAAPGIRVRTCARHVAVGDADRATSTSRTRPAPCWSGSGAWRSDRRGRRGAS